MSTNLIIWLLFPSWIAYPSKCASQTQGLSPVEKILEVLVRSRNEKMSASLAARDETFVANYSMSFSHMFVSFLHLSFRLSVQQTWGGGRG